jgi:hypothetical protein
VEPNIRRAISAIIRIDSVPTEAAENRQPKELVGPKIHSPKPIIHLPAGGWTTKSGWFRKTWMSPAFHFGSTTLPSPAHLSS